MNIDLYGEWGEHALVDAGSWCWPVGSLLSLLALACWLFRTGIKRGTAGWWLQALGWICSILLFLGAFGLFITAPLFLAPYTLLQRVSLQNHTYYLVEYSFIYERDIWVEECDYTGIVCHKIIDGLFGNDDYPQNPYELKADTQTQTLVLIDMGRIIAKYQPASSVWPLYGLP